MYVIQTEQNILKSDNWLSGLSFRFFIQLVKDALSGKKFDYTSISLTRAIFLLALPMVLEMFMETLFAIIDIIFVSRLGEDAITAVGLTESLMTIVYALAAGISVATAAVISRRIGQNNENAAKVVLIHAVLIGVIISIFTAFIGFFFATPILSLLEASDSVQLIGSSYVKICLGSNVVVMLLFIINAAFRSAGDPALSFRVLLYANLINIFLDPILIFGIGSIPGMGIDGAATSTLISRSIGVVIQLYYLFSGKGRIHLKLNEISINLKYAKHLLLLSFGGIFQNLVANASWIWLVRIISSYGSSVTAGYTIAIRIVIFVLLPSWGISNATATLVGQNLGAKNTKRAEKAIWYTSLYNLIFLGFIGLIITFFSEEIMAIFIKDADIIASGTHSLQLLCYGFILYGFGMVLIQALNGAGDTITPSIIYFVCYWLVQIPVAYLLAEKTQLQENSVYIAILTGETLMAVVGVIMIRLGYWKKVKL